MNDIRGAFRWRDAVDIALVSVVIYRILLMFKARVNLAEVREGESVIQLLPEQVQVPPGVLVTRITPARLRFTAVGAAKHTVRVTPKIAGTPAPGYAVERVRANPASVQIKGPRTTIERRDEIATAPVDVSGSRETVTRTVALALPDSVYPTNERTVQVVVEIRAEAGLRQREGDSKQ